MRDPFKAAVIQMSSVADKEKNLATAARLLAEAVDQGAELIVLPLGDDDRPPLEVVCSNPPTVHHLAEAPWEPV